MAARRNHVRPLAAAALASALLALGAPAADADQAQYERGYELGTKAYQYGVPLLDTRRIYRTATSVSKSDGRANGPVNRFSHARSLARPEDRTVVAPNHDTLYSLAWLNLARQPRIIHIPKLERPVLRLRAGLPLDRELPQHRHPYRRLGRRRLRDRRPRFPRQAARGRDQDQVAV